MVILNNKQINQKIRRISTQILEENFGEKELFLVGLNNKGFSFGKKQLIYDLYNFFILIKLDSFLYIILNVLSFFSKVATLPVGGNPGPSVSPTK